MRHCVGLSTTNDAALVTSTGVGLSVRVKAGETLKKYFEHQFLKEIKSKTIQKCAIEDQVARSATELVSTFWLISNLDST